MCVRALTHARLYVDGATRVENKSRGKLSPTPPGSWIARDYAAALVAGLDNVGVTVQDRVKSVKAESATYFHQARRAAPRRAAEPLARTNARTGGG